MLKEGLYVSENHENALEAYTIKMHVKEASEKKALIIFSLVPLGIRISLVFYNYIILKCFSKTPSALF